MIIIITKFTFLNISGSFFVFLRMNKIDRIKLLCFNAAYDFYIPLI